jgi:hypothetical protein
VDHDGFIDFVRPRAGIPASWRLGGMPLTDTDMAENLTSAPPQVLTLRISGGEARDLAVQPSAEFAEDLRRGRPGTRRSAPQYIGARRRQSRIARDTVGPAQPGGTV